MAEPKEERQSKMSIYPGVDWQFPDDVYIAALTEDKDTGKREVFYRGVNHPDLELERDIVPKHHQLVDAIKSQEKNRNLEFVAGGAFVRDKEADDNHTIRFQSETLNTCEKEGQMSEELKDEFKKLVEDDLREKYYRAYDDWK